MLRKTKTSWTNVYSSNHYSRSRYKQALKEVDFIKRYIFPGSFIPSVHAILRSNLKESDLKLSHLEDMTYHAKTLSIWRKNFLEKQDKIKNLGFDREFIKLWDYYFSYCTEGLWKDQLLVCNLFFLLKCRNDISLYCQWQRRDV